MKTIEDLNRDLLIKQFNEYKVETFEDLNNIVNYLKIKIDDIKYPFLEKEIDELGFSVRAFNCLIYHLQKQELYDTQKERPKAKHIINLSKQRLISTGNIGAKSICEIEQVLNENGYSLKP